MPPFRARSSSHADPHAFAAQIGEHRRRDVDRLQAFHEERVARLHAVEHFARVDHVEHRARRRAGERIAAVGRPCTPTENTLAISFVVSIAPIGKPPPKPFALVRMSGTMPFCMYEKSAPVRPIPLWISSRIRSAPCRVHRRRAACRNSGRARRHAAFALHRLEHHCADLGAVRGELALERRDVVVREVRDAWRDSGPKPRRIFRLAAGRHREQRAPWNALTP
jgi:hypothetical protein